MVESRNKIKYLLWTKVSEGIELFYLFKKSPRKLPHLKGLKGFNFI